VAGRLETATAMEDTRLKKVPCAKFLERLAADSLLEGFVKYLAVRVADQQEVIANLVTVDSEQRLGTTLLHLAKQMGEKGPSQHAHRVEDFTRRTVEHDRNDAAPRQRVYAEISEPGAD
jgi:CRP-like cAMP-binding protein